MKRKLTKILAILLAITTALTCLNFIVPAKEIQEEPVTEVQEEINEETQEVPEEEILDEDNKETITETPVQEESTSIEQQDNNEIQPRITTNGMNKSDWNIKSQTDSEIVLNYYKGPETEELVVPGEMDGKQVYIIGSTDEDHDTTSLYPSATSLGRGSEVTSIVFQEVNGKKVKVKNNRLTGLFYDYSDPYILLTSIDVRGLDATSVTDMAYMFRNCTSLTTIIGLETLKITSVIDMYGVFENCSSLTDISALSNWNVSSVTDMGYMFSGCSKITSLVPLRNWKFSSSLTSLAGMFSGCSSLTDLTPLATWDTSSITDMKNLFSGCSSLTHLNGLESWNTSALFNDVNAGSGMSSGLCDTFSNCTSLTDLTAIANWDISSIKSNLMSTFSGCTSLTDLTPLKDWDISAHSISSMFSGCTSLTDLTPLATWDVSSVRNMNSMFYGCTSLKTLKGLETWDVSRLGAMYGYVWGTAYMFGNCTNLADITALKDWNTKSIVDMAYMFSGCTSLTDLIPLQNWNLASLQSPRGMFQGCTKLTTLKGLEDWVFPRATMLDNMFADCTSLTDITALTNWDTSKIIEMQSTFKGCTSLTDITPISTWDVSAVEHMTRMFYNCKKLTFADLSNWNFNESCVIVNMFRVSGDRVPLLVISSNDKWKDYNYVSSNRSPMGPTFDAGDGKFPDHISKKQGNTTNVLDNTTTAVDTFIQQALDTMEEPLKVDHAFINWESDITDSATIQERMNATYTPTWRLEPWLVISFDSLGGSEVPIQKVKEGRAAEAPMAPIKDGYAFENWYESINAMIPYDFTTPITENKTLYAKYTEVPYLISYVMNDEANTIDQTQTYTISSQIIKLQAPSRPGYEFIGWTYVHGTDIITKPVEELTIPKGSIGDWVLFANWKKLTDAYTIRFDSLGGSNVADQIVNKGGQVIEPEAPVKEGYTFTGWKEGKTRGNEYDFTTEVNENKTLYASWQEETYTISYELHGGENHPNNPNEYTINSSTIEIQEPSREGYVFTGWTYQHEDITTTTPSEELYIPTGSIGDWSFEANWKETKEPVVSFDTDGGSEVRSQEIEKGMKAIRPVNPIKEGYIFEDWYESGSTDPYNFDTLIQEDKTLYARYEEEEYHIVYVLNGGTNADNPVSYTITSRMEPIKEPSKEGYKFTGWSYVHGTEIVTKPNGTTLSIPSGSTGDWVLIANWEKEEAIGFVLYNGGIQLLNNGTERDDWVIASETDSEIVLGSYKGSSTDIIIPGEMDGKQVYINGGSGKDATGLLSGSTSFTLTFQEVNRKKVKVKNHTLRRFCYCKWYLRSFDGSGLDTTGVTDMSSLFYGCDELTKITGLENWNTTSVTNMGMMFQSCKMRTIDVTNWNTSSVTSMSNMFSGCDFLNKIIGLENWDVSAVTTMNSMFSGCMSIYDLTPLTNWKVSAVQDMYGMFYGCMSIYDLTPFTNWNVSSVYDMRNMFAGCESLEEVTGLKNWDTSKVEYMTEIFSWDPDLWFIDLSNWNLDRVYEEETYYAFCDLFKMNYEGSDDYGLQPLLVICKDERLKNYDYATDDRIPVGPTFDAYGGNFSDGSTSKQPQATYVLENTTTAVDSFIDQALEMIETPTREGYKFVEWQVDLKEDASVYKRMSATYRARWAEEEKKIVKFSFDSQGGTQVEYQVLDAEGKVSKPNDPVREHYIFQGWYLDKEGTKEYDFDTPVIEDLTLYAKWQEISYSIRYVGAEGNDLPTSYTFYSPEITIQEAIKPGYTFTGWTYIHGREISMIPSMEVIIPSGSTEEMVLFASWKEHEAIKVTFDVDGGSKVESQDLLSGMSVERPEDPSKKGYSFDNWYEDKGYTTVHDFSKPLTSDTTLYAKWNIISYGIQYELDGGINDPSNPSSYTIEDGNISIKEPTKEGYTFIGWTYDNGEIQTRKPSKELYISSRSQKEWKLTAQYQKVEENYTVTFYEEGNKIEEQVVKEGKKAVEIISPEKEGYVFIGWYEGGEAFDFDRVINEDTILTAKYKEEEYHITYWKEEVTRATNQSTYTITSPEITLEQPSKAGYHFLGWSYVHGDKMNMTPSKSFSIPRGSTGDWVIFENWQEKEKYEISFDVDGGSKVEDQIIEEGNKVNRPSDPSKKGYTFIDWYEEGSDTPFDFNTILTKDTNLQARWNILSYKIMYELDGGTNPVDNPNSYTIEDGDIKIKEPSKKGYTFMGWTCEHDGVETTTPSKEIMISTGSIEDWKFIAHYERNVYTVNFDTDGGSKVESQVVEEENKALRPIDPSKKGHTFIGWYEKGSDIPYDFDTPIIEDKELIAKYEEITYQISYEMDEGINPVENPSSYTVTSPEIKLKEPTKEGYTFIGWTYEHGNIVVSKPSKEVIIPTGSIEDWKFTANFKEIINSYTIRFESNGGSEVASQVVEEGSKAVKPSEPTRAGYTFEGWYEDKGCNKEYNFETIIDQDRVIYAKWQEEKVITSDPTRMLPNMMMLAVSLIGIIVIKKRVSD